VAAKLNGSFSREISLLRVSLRYFLMGVTLLLAPAVTAEVPMPVAFSDVTALPVNENPVRHAYGEHPSQFGELWLPESVNNTVPIVVLIHGGCWLSQFDVTHIRPLAAALSDAGYAVWAPEYRRVGEPGGGWPGTFEDIAAAVDHLRDLPINATPVDFNRVVLAGHSAGGHLALWAAARSNPKAGAFLASDSATVPVGVVGLAAITNLEEYAAGEGSCQQATPQLLGGSPDDVTSRYAQTSPAALRLAAPTLLLQGLADPIVPLSQARSLPGATVIEIPDAGHFDLIHPGTAAFPHILRAIAELEGS